MRLLAAIFFASAVLCQAAENAAGRWEGSAQISGEELKLIVDLSEESGGAWIGSIIIPGFGVKGAPLGDIAVKDSEFVFTIKGALGNERVGKAEFNAWLWLFAGKFPRISQQVVHYDAEQPLVAIAGDHLRGVGGDQREPVGR